MKLKSGPVKSYLIIAGRYFPYAIGLLSFANIICMLIGFKVFTFYSTTVSLAGIAVFITHFNRDNYNITRYLIGFWIWSQLFAFNDEHYFTTYTNVLGQERYIYTEPLLNGLQLVWFNIFSISGKYNIVIVNGMLAIYFVLQRLYKVARLEGERIQLYKLRGSDTSLDNFMPTQATIVRMVQMAKNDDWLLIQTDRYLYMDDCIINYFIIQCKDGSMLVPGSGNQILYMRAVIDLNDIKQYKNVGYYPVLDWVVCV